MVVAFAFSTYHHRCCGFDSHSTLCDKVC